MFKKLLSVIVVFFCCVSATFDVFAGEMKHGLECAEKIYGKKFVFMFGDEAMLVYECQNDGFWHDSGESVKSCFPAEEANPLRLAPEGFNITAGGDLFHVYLNNSGVLSGGVNGVYEYRENKNVMCWWCAPGMFAYVDNDGNFNCGDDEKYAWFNVAKNKNGENVEWKDGAAECVESGKEWNNVLHSCITVGADEVLLPDVKCGIQCDSNALNVVCTEDGFARSFICDVNQSKWIEKDPETLSAHWCPAGEGDVFQVAAKTGMVATGWKNNKESKYIYINTKLAESVAVDVYKSGFDNNHNIMCFDCPVGWYGFEIDNVRYCNKSEPEAWCEFAKNKNGENVKWKKTGCKCADSDKKWDKSKHKCVEK